MNQKTADIFPSSDSSYEYDLFGGWKQGSDGETSILKWVHAQSLKLAILRTLAFITRCPLDTRSLYPFVRRTNAYYDLLAFGCLILRLQMSNYYHHYYELLLKILFKHQLMRLDWSVYFRGH